MKMRFVAVLSAQIVVFVIGSLKGTPVALGQIPDSWQQVPKEDLVLKENPANPGSVAMILERQIYTDDEKRLQTEWVRIKVFTEAGRSYADVQIPYQARNTTIEGIRGRTIRSDGTIVAFDGTVFDSVLLKYKRFRYDVKTFTLPGVEAGSVIEYAYTIRWKEKTPDYVRNPYGYIVDTSFTIPITTWTIQRELFTRHAVFTLRPVKAGRVGYARVRLTDLAPSSQPDGTLRMEVTNIAALEKEDYMPPEDMITSRVHLYYQIGFEGRYWQDVGKIRAENAEKFIEKTKFLERAANEIAPPDEQPEARLRKLYARVQKVRNTQYDSSKTEKEIDREHLSENKSSEDIYRHGYGYGNEINYLFTALARSAGFDASIIEVTSRDSGKFEEVVPDVSQLNGMLVEVRLNGKNLFFDPASRFCPYGLLPWYENDVAGVRWDKVAGQLVKVDVSDQSELKRTADLKLDANGGLEGDLELSFTGQLARELRISAADEDEAGRQKQMEEEIKQWTPSGTTTDDTSVTGWADAEQPLRARCRLKIQRFGIVSKQRILLPVSVFEDERKSALSQVYRIQPVYLEHGSTDVDQITISLPIGYQVEALPSEAAYLKPFAEFNSKVTSEANILRIERHEVLEGYYFRLQDYSPLRQYFQKVRQRDAENLVLRRVESVHTR